VYIPTSETSTVTVRGFTHKDNGQFVLTVHLQGDQIAEQCNDGRHNMRFGLIGSSFDCPRFQRDLREVAMREKFPVEMFDRFVEVNDYQFSLTKVRASIRSTKNELSNCQGKIENNEARLPKLEADLDVLKGKLAALETKETLQDESEQLPLLKAELSAKRESFQKLAKKSDDEKSLNDEQKMLKREIDVIVTRIRDLSNPRSNLRADIADVEERIAKADRETKAAKKDITRLQSKLAGLTTDEADLSKKISRRLNS